MSDSNNKRVVRLKNKLKAKTTDSSILFTQCISCGTIVDTGEYCNGGSCRFDDVKRSNTVSYTGHKKDGHNSYGDRKQSISQ